MAKLRIFLDGDMGACRGVVNALRRTFQTPLERHSVLAKVVQQTHCLAPWRGAKPARSLSCQSTHCVQMPC